MRSDEIRKALLEEFPELSSGETVIQKEVYAHFGVLYYAFAVVEHSMQNIVTFDAIYKDLKAGKIRGQLDWEKGIDKHFLSASKMTLGNMIDKIKKIKEFKDITSQMDEIRRIRNYISHHFFREEIAFISSETGSWLLLEKMYTARAGVMRLEDSLTERTERLYSRIGFSVPKEEFVKSIIQRETAKAEALVRDGLARVGWETGDMTS